MFALMLVVDLNGPTMMARIGIMKALNRGHAREFDTTRKDTPLRPAEIETRSVMVTLKIGFALVDLSAAFSSLPRGPERRACAMREHPGMFEAERCRQLARERGDTYHTATGAGGIRESIQGCMRRKQR